MLSNWWEYIPRINSWKQCCWVKGHMQLWFWQIFLNLPSTVYRSQWDMSALASHTLAHGAVNTFSRLVCYLSAGEFSFFLWPRFIIFSKAYETFVFFSLWTLFLCLALSVAVALFMLENSALSLCKEPPQPVCLLSSHTSNSPARSAGGPTICDPATMHL